MGQCSSSTPADSPAPRAPPPSSHHATSRSASSSSAASAAADPEWRRAPFDVQYEKDTKKKLGEGNYAAVYRCWPRNSAARPPPCYAVKCILKSKLTKEDMDALAVEVKAMEMLKDHPNFVRIIDFFNERCVCRGCACGRGSARAGPPLGRRACR